MHLELDVLNSQLALYEKKESTSSVKNKTLRKERFDLKEKLKEKEKELEQRFPRQVMNASRNRLTNKRRVQVALVVRHEKCPALGWQVLASMGTKTIKRTHRHLDHRPQQFVPDDLCQG